MLPREEASLSMNVIEDLVNQCRLEKLYLENSVKSLAEQKAKLQKQVDQVEAQIRSLSDECQSLTDKRKLLYYKLDNQKMSYSRSKETFEKRKEYFVQLSEQLSEKCAAVNDERFARFEQFMDIYHAHVAIFLRPFERKTAEVTMETVSEEAKRASLNLDDNNAADQSEVQESLEQIESMEVA